MTSSCSIQTRRAGFLGLGLLALVSTGCPGNGGTTTDDPGTTTAQTTGDATTTPTTTPTTTTQTSTQTSTPTTADPTTGGELSTTGMTTGEPSTTESGTSTGGEPAVACPSLETKETCVADQDCKWSGVVEFTYSAQGCQGGIVDFCIPKKLAGGASAWYREVDGDTEVVEFGYTPADLDETWKQCDCDGPLACLCTSVTEDCPDRQEEFCGVNITELGCKNTTFKGNTVCGWFSVDPQGPNDDMCTQNTKYDQCLPAYDTDKTDCKAEKAPLPPYPDENMVNKCSGVAVNPVYWHEKDGVLEITEACGPKPLGWTHCESVDTPALPDECGCNCT